MVKPAVDYTLYLVTGRELVPPGKDYYESLEESLKGGVTVVQVREKKVDTREFLEVARKTKEICDRYNIPVLINDRVDIAIAIKAHGVHVGQDDMPIEVARSILGNDAIIGVSAGTVDEAKAAVAAGADYIGIGAVYPTGSKSNAKLLGVRGVGPILSVLEGTNVKSVVIGGIKSVNLLRVLHGAVSPAGKPVDGIAVISEIISSQDPRASASHLIAVLRSFYNAGPSSKSSSLIPNIFKSETSTISPVYLVPTSPDPAHASTDTIKQNAAHLLTLVKRYTPMIHQITNNVVINQSANATLALGASPIMATAEAEQEDLAKIPGGLLVNFGTVTDKAGMLAAGKWANFNRKPVVFDPVGVGATGFRRSTAKELLDAWQAAVIKGNAGEIASLLGTSEVQSRGVDSVGSGFANPAEAVLTLARSERCVVVMTGPTDYISNGQTVVKLDNGCELLGNITGSGCMVGTAVATFCGAASVDALRNNAEDSKKGALVEGDMFVAAIAGVLAVTVAADIAVANERVKGPASFLTQLLDELYALTPEKIVNFGKVALAQV
ncbi:hypothetical protein FRC04_011231 [Tulasnella sp. 424]|nr:hypothetical protein FRC04_011231 [Tulasnella sp. 424]KAG8971764.1 hypothetical protein FRC05_010831 [Tulasnella sp. 425]